MRLFLFGLFSALLTGAGCGSDRNGSVRDAGGGGTTDTGMTRADAGPPSDAGPEPDSGGSTPTECPEAVCDILTGGGCGEGEACYLAEAEGEVAPMCAMAGKAAREASCENANSCQEGLICVDGTCKAACCNLGASEGCPDGQACTVQLSGIGGEPLGIGYCVTPETCDLVTQVGCESPESCYASDLAAGTVLCIRPGDDVAEGETCTSANSCRAGLGCLSTDGESFTCLKFCYTNAKNSVCGEGQTCRALSSSGIENLGVCDPPPAS